MKGLSSNGNAQYNKANYDRQVAAPAAKARRAPVHIGDCPPTGSSDRGLAASLREHRDGA